MNTNTEIQTFNAEVYFMPVAMEIADLSKSFYKQDADRAEALGIDGYEDGAPLVEVVISTPGMEDNSWYNDRLPKELEAYFAFYNYVKDPNSAYRGPRYVPASFAAQLCKFDGVETSVAPEVKIAWKCSDYQGLKGDNRAKDILNINLSYTIKQLKNNLADADLKDKIYRDRAKHLVTFLKLAGAADEAYEWEAAVREVEEVKTEYSFV